MTTMRPLRSPAAAQTLGDFLVDEVERHPTDLVPRAAAEFQVSRQAVHHHLNRLLRAGVLRAEGRTRARRYELVLLGEIDERLDAREPLPWLRRFRPVLAEVPADVVEIARFGCAEIVRNAFDHSGSSETSVRLRRTAAAVEIRVSDAGAGIFRRLARVLGVEDPRLAALEIARGRSLGPVARAFDTFVVYSDRHVLRREARGGHGSWSLEPLAARVRGTTVGVRIRVRSGARIEDVLARTHAEIPLRLAFAEGEQPTSREQARRILPLTPPHGGIVVDFGGVACVGPAFADELLRALPRRRPELRLAWRNASPAVDRALRHAAGASARAAEAAPPVPAL
jgi:anti-sigma regulatory factor (Ser/Thr protein kinase)